MLLKNKIFIISSAVIFIIIIASLVILIFNERKEGLSKNGVKNLVICDSNKEKEISQLRQEGGIVKDMEERQSVLIGFYTNQNAYHLQGAAKTIAERLGWKDFIDGFAPPTPLLFDTPQTFQDGDLIEIEIKGYETIETGGPGLWSSMDVIRVSKARKLSLPTRQGFIQQAKVAFGANTKNIFQCADSKAIDFPSFESGIERTVVWDRLHNQALVTYQGTKEYHGDVKVIDISILLDQSGTPVSILVGSKIVPLTL